MGGGNSRTCRKLAGGSIFYVPVLEWIHELKKTYGPHPEFGQILAFCEHEAEMYRKYKRYYGYTIFVMQNV